MSNGHVYDMEYREEDNPHTPTNLPENFQEKANHVFEHVETWSVNAGAVKYVYPKTEEGYHDYSLMLDLMGLEDGVIFKTNGDKHIVLNRRDSSVKWGEWYTVENGAIETMRFNGEESKKILYSPGDGYSPKGLWKDYIYGNVTVVGNIEDM